MDLFKTLHIAASGMRAQGTRLRVIAENVANAESLAQTPGGQPYRRKLVSFANAMDRELGAETVRVRKIMTDKSEFSRAYQPGHPAADDDGYVLRPNVNTLIEMTDMREAQRSYEANLKAIEASRSMLQKTLQILS
ncbi:flagellar basal body rod protein FlgC [Denitrobaculum tricleocarpae]|uniref:Flagellar basal-body rod protein FlgC n=1 Tax=Denitrobaculum tricleocarpae TaxID=2591009 RepID=A0A545T1Z7_9PROT|nr:flagellar basal body rod protein FlgC [Denitrobaculum tricleocarpae]TQV71254.1 flagellar basal body rod protein FlgC [Denitrobaculum tricleocarpae]